MTKGIIYESITKQIRFTNSKTIRKITKIIKPGIWTEKEKLRLNNEFNIVNYLKIKGVRQALNKETIEGRPALHLKYIDAETVKEAFTLRKQPISVFLKTAILIAGILGKIHQKNIIHKDINPNNILVNLCNSKFPKVVIIDFGISAHIKSYVQQVIKIGKIEGTLAYISPEQTGQQTTIVDCRTDFYSLGATFYEMLTGQPPFASNDRRELVKIQTTTSPTPPHLINNKIPKIFSEVILKLLAKKVDDRYQSAYSLKSDLEKIQTRYTLSTK